MIDNDLETGYELAEKLGREFNFFGSFSKKAQTLYNGFAEEEKSMFLACICLAGLDLSDHYKSVNCREWDERKEASEDFAYRNEIFFSALFERLMGFKPSVSGDAPYLLRKLDKKEFADCKWLLGFLEKWEQEHSTIKQAIFGGTVIGILCEQYSDYNFAPPLGQKSISFPFI